MTSFASDLACFLRERRVRLRREAIAAQFAEFTMTPVHLFADNLRLAESVKTVPGCVVECGVWRGGMSAGIASVLGPDRTYYLYDSFEGLPEPKLELDGKKAVEYQNDKDSEWYLNNCAAEPEYAERAMRLAGARNFKLIKGWFQDTVPVNPPDEPIALLRLDGDWYDSTIVCLEHLFQKVVPGGLIIMDDYFAWDGCLRALHDYLSRTQATERIQNIQKICYMIKKARD